MAGIKAGAGDAPARPRIIGVLLWIGFAVILLSRLLAFSLPLIITNDGAVYIAWARSLVEQRGYSVPPLRTPGYPYFLAGVFSIFGYGSFGVLFFQHLLGVLTSLFAYLTARSLGRPLLGMAFAVLLALDPFVYVLETYALSETLTIFLICVAACTALTAKRGRWWPGLVIGVALGLGCLARPAVQVLAPFFALGWAIRSFGWRRRAIAGCAVTAAAALVVLAPWLNFNIRRGIYGISQGFGTFQWIGLAHQGMLDPEYSPPADLKAAYAAMGPRAREADQLVTFVLNHDGFQARAADFGAWARASVRHDIGLFLKRTVLCVLWQLNYKPHRGGHPSGGEATWLVLRASDDGTNDQFDGEFAGSILADFEEHSAGGPVRALLRPVGEDRRPGIPQIPLAALSILFIPLAIWRRRWDIALISVGAALFVVLHAAMLIPWNRYAMPMQPLWYLVIVAGLAALWPRRPAPPAPPDHAAEHDEPVEGDSQNETGAAKN